MVFWPPFCDRGGSLKAPSVTEGVAFLCSPPAGEGGKGIGRERERKTKLGRGIGEGHGEENEAGEGDDDSKDGSNDVFFSECKAARAAECVSKDGRRRARGAGALPSLLRGAAPAPQLSSMPAPRRFSIPPQGPPMERISSLRECSREYSPCTCCSRHLGGTTRNSWCGCRC